MNTDGRFSSILWETKDEYIRLVGYAPNPIIALKIEAEVEEANPHEKVCFDIRIIAVGKKKDFPEWANLKRDNITKLKAVLFFVKCPVCLSILRKTEDSDLFYCEGCDVVIDPIHILRSDRAGKPVCPTCFGSLTPIYVAEKIIGDIY